MGLSWLIKSHKLVPGYIVWMPGVHFLADAEYEWNIVGSDFLKRK